MAIVQRKIDAPPAPPPVITYELTLDPAEAQSLADICARVGGGGLGQDHADAILRALAGVGVNYRANNRAVTGTITFSDFA